jgi:hypothetical protein
MFLVEDCIEVDTIFTVGGVKELAHVEFVLEHPSIVFITYGAAYPSGTSFWLSIDEDSIGMTRGVPTYITELTEGTHTIDFIANLTHGIRVINPRLQVIVFLQDGSALSESPPDDDNPTPITSILTSGNMVHVEGCSEVYNLSGQRVDCEVNNGNIPLNTLSAGTYFAKGSTGRTTKIVKTY